MPRSIRVAGIDEKPRRKYCLGGVLPPEEHVARLDQPRRLRARRSPEPRLSRPSGPLTHTLRAAYSVADVDIPACDARQCCLDGFWLRSSRASMFSLQQEPIEMAERQEQCKSALIIGRRMAQH